MSPSVNEERTMYTGKFMARCLCMVGIVDLVEVSVRGMARLSRRQVI